MKQIVFFILSLSITQIIHAQPPGFKWAKRVGGTNDDAGVKISVDADGNVYTVGSFRSVVDFDPGPGTATLSANGNQDVFLLKTDSMGNFIWAKKIGGPYSDYINAVMLDDNGFFYITGFFSGTVDFDPGTGTAALSSSGVGDNDCYVAKYDTAGNYVWAKRIGGSLSDYGYGIARDANQHILLTGSFRNMVDFDPNAGVFNMTAFGDYDIFVAQLDTAGNFMWATQSGGSGIDHGFAIATDVQGNVYTTGVFSGTADFDPGTNVFAMTVAGSASDEDVFVSKLDNAGNFIWAKRFGGLNYDNAASIAVDSQGVHTTGYFWGTVDFDPGAGVSNLTALGANDIFISKLDTAGNYKWAKRMGITGFNAGGSVVLDSQGAVYCSGYFNGSPDFDPGTGVYNLYSAGGSDVFMLKLDSAGNFNWARSVGGNGSDEGNLYRDQQGSIYLAGDFTGTVDLNPGSGVTSYTSNGNADAFILKMTACQPTTSMISATACDGYLYNSTYYALSATYIFTYQNSNGCDSTIILDLTINNSSVSVFTQIACDSFTVAGITYTTSGFYPLQTYTNAVGCDSAVMLQLIINHSSASMYAQTACDSYFFNGITYTGSGNYTQSYTNISGCDSSIQLQLLINQSNTSIVNDTACVSYLLNGQTYTSSGSYTQNFTNAGGCDSVLTLNLTIPVVNSTVTQVGTNLTANATGALYQWVWCPSYTPIAGATNATYAAFANGDYAVIVTQNGCTDTSACYTVNGVGLGDQALHSGIAIYPNPVHGQLTIMHSLAGASINGELTNVFGQRLMLLCLNTQRTVLDLSHLTPGVYYLYLTDRHEKIRWKVVKD